MASKVAACKVLVKLLDHVAWERGFVGLPRMREKVRQMRLHQLKQRRLLRTTRRVRCGKARQARIHLPAACRASAHVIAGTCAVLSLAHDARCLSQDTYYVACVALQSATHAARRSSSTARRVSRDDEDRGDTDFWIRTITLKVRDEMGYALVSTSDAVSADGTKGKTLKFGHDEAGMPFDYWVTVVVQGRLFLVESGAPHEKLVRLASGSTRVTARSGRRNARPSAGPPAPVPTSTTETFSGSSCASTKASASMSSTASPGARCRWAERVVAAAATR